MLLGSGGGWLACLNAWILQNQNHLSQSQSGLSPSLDNDLDLYNPQAFNPVTSLILSLIICGSDCLFVCFYSRVVFLYTTRPSH
jgi:hypothetical protein